MNQFEVDQIQLATVLGQVVFSEEEVRAATQEFEPGKWVWRVIAGAGSLRTQFQVCAILAIRHQGEATLDVAIVDHEDLLTEDNLPRLALQTSDGKEFVATSPGKYELLIPFVVELGDDTEILIGSQLNLAT